MCLVRPAHTTLDCGSCGARTKHALPLSERTYACTACGAVSPRDKNWRPRDARARPPGALLQAAA
ncbi:zinc ribbon domain-containing protein [Streptomyces sp. NPDC001292]|uniref:zinc ribbon domain-containing protein n=1 Tax=Streptomyces sp. NPDC001292 TaxID=3364558 RepID=UPI0036C5D141